MKHYDPTRPLDGEEYVEGANLLSYLAQWARAYPAVSLAASPLASDSLPDAILLRDWLDDFVNGVTGERDAAEREVHDYVESCRRAAP